MIAPLDLGDDATLAALHALQRRSYRVEAELVGFGGIPGLVESAAELRACGETFLGWREGRRLCAALSYKLDAGTLDIHRLVVDPADFRRGLGRRLVRAALAVPAVARVIVSTGEANQPARRLYESEGFRTVERAEVAPGLWVVRLERAGG
jgi:ribosomal protein S18 acetylase RimI-like enzyme